MLSLCTCLFLLFKIAMDFDRVLDSFEMYGHRQVTVNQCPGDNLYALIQTWPHWVK